ncbi:Methionine-R-sulfoxide reductase, putative [Gryllus bimaculatus]|nr:Methionine-R-sulfoxide reductase, putative [Gryllus bimaculatus]
MAFCSWKGEEYYRDHFRSGTYHCVKCNYGLFSSLSKYKHDSRLPSFATPLNKDSLSKVPEKNLRLTLKERKLQRRLEKRKVIHHHNHHQIRLKIKSFLVMIYDPRNFR